MIKMVTWLKPSNEKKTILIKAEHINYSNLFISIKYFNLD